MALGSSRNNSNIEILNLCLGKCLYSVFSEIIKVTNNPTLKGIKLVTCISEGMLNTQ